MTLDQLKTFQTVAGARSFRRAGELLHLSQPAISKQIQALEVELDQRLFERGRNSKLTAAGTALLKHVSDLSRILKAAREEIADLRELRGGHLAIGAAHSIAHYVLPGLIGSYRAKYPEVNLSIEAGWSLELIRRIAAYELDIGLLVLVEPTLRGYPQLTFTPLTTTDLVFVTSFNDPLTKRRKITWDDLAKARWILNQEGCQYRSYIKRRFEERGQPMRVEVEVIGLELQKKLSQLGLGVALLPSPFVKTEIERGSLKRLNIVGTSIKTHSCLVFRSDKYISGPVKSFFQLLETGFGPAMKDLRKYFNPG